MPVQNAEVAAIFEQTAELLDIKGEDQVRIRAYRRTARTIEALPLSLATLHERGVDLATVPGIGKEFAPELATILATGQSTLLEGLQRELPGELGAIAAIPGLGPKRVKLLYEHLRVRTIDDLRHAAQEGLLRDIRGLGMAVEKRVLAILSRSQQQRRLSLPMVESEVQALVAALGGGLKDAHVVVAGSYRRRRDTISDLDLLVTGANGGVVCDRLVSHENVAEIRMQGSTRTSVVLHCGLQVDLRVVAEDSYGAALLYFTGSKRHNVALRTLAGVRGWKLNEYGLFAGKRRVAGESEDEIYGKLGLKYIPPELREDRGEIASAREDHLPDLVTLDDIRGDLHVRANWTDGTTDIEGLVAAARVRGYKYVAIIDDARRIRQAQGIDQGEFARRIAEIDRHAGGPDGVAILKGIEADILPDGRLDLPEEITSRLDLVAAGIHSQLDLPAADQTDRLVRAMRNPRMSMLAHPTGRRIGEREPCALDFDRLVAAARDEKCVLELDSDPLRLDLDDAHARAAKAAGAKVAICSNADSPDQLPQIRFGVDQARRGWLTAADVVNTRPLADIKAMLAR